MSDSSFSDDELALLRDEDRALGRIATVGADGMPHVVPSGWAFNDELATVDATGRDVANTKKYRDVAETGRAAIVIDGIASDDNWAPWAVEIRSQATPIPGPPALIRIAPDRIVSWNLGSRKNPS